MFVVATKCKQNSELEIVLESYWPFMLLNEIETFFSTPFLAPKTVQVNELKAPVQRTSSVFNVFEARMCFS